jgi:nudix-type nucleoside diphosphatase (YffH/AdpP family)
MPTQKRVVTVHGQRRVFDGIFKIDDYDVSHSKLNEPGMIEHAHRFVFERGDSAAALLHVVDRDVIILTEQFRMATHAKGPGWIIETLAGSIEEGETAEACIRREVMGEVGYRTSLIEPIARFYVSPGGTSERIFLFYAPVSSEMLEDPQASGVAGALEDVRRIEVPRDEFIKDCIAGNYEDAKTLIAGLWLARQKPPRARK